ncbi:Putative ribosome biogenesis GTPase RsgA [Roseovarius gaetbuli]|uniref:Small ribosomal subunit biogenesis GTPase RsgA n=1 Tax=Roseovarius gaetbuli TaxID=1356575 RepID=A0A1X6YG93_9RHOB|nr:ribosome small subunit-dependent GTPase A [Roseovarius gaetbuli]SLN18538.1 Putative ribosome biogenesis GTPase RsgA [Roseovarius gaetbuli]
MTQISAPSATPLAALGWSETFEAQLTPEETALAPMRIATVHRSRVTALSPSGAIKLNLFAHASTTDFAVGDWVLVDPETNTITRRLERSSLLRRRTEGTRAPQLIAANIDTLFIVTSCNADFNPARLERYLALANEAGTTPVIVLTKADMAEDTAGYQTRAAALQRGLAVLTLNAKDIDSAAALAPWCAPGQTVALVGSSGVGKSTLLNTLAAKDDATAQPTSGIREDDAKGRHTTTSRSLHAIKGGGLAIDTPGMRSLHVSDVGAGLDKLFSEIAELAPECRFRDCTHAHEPGCAIQAAVAAGVLDPDRLERWRKLDTENRDNTPVAVGARGNKTIKKPRQKR